MNTWFRFVICCGIAVFLCGCENQEVPEGFPKLNACSVEVLQDGKPLEGATVGLFSPDCQWAVGGATDANGKAVMWTQGKYEGAPVGKYKVTVTKSITEEEPSGSDGAPPAVNVFNTIAKPFRMPKTTTLEMEVVDGKNPTVTLDVGSGVKEPVK